MSATLKTALVLVGVTVVQVGVFADVRFFGVAPELLALVAVLAGFFGGPVRGTTIAFAAGLLWDIWLPSPLGVAAIVYALVAFAVGSVEEGLFHDSRLQRSMVAFVGTAAAVVGYALLGEVVGVRGLVDLDLLRVAGVAGLLNALLTPLAVPPLRWAWRDDTGTAARRRSAPLVR